MFFTIPQDEKILGYEKINWQNAERLKLYHSKVFNLFFKDNLFKIVSKFPELYNQIFCQKSIFNFDYLFDYLCFFMDKIEFFKQ